MKVAGARFSWMCLCVSLPLILLCFVFQGRSYADEIISVPYLDGVDGQSKHHLLPGRFALVIGVDSYSAARTVDLHDLPGAVNDAVAVAKVLREKASFDATILTAYPDPENNRKYDQNTYKPLTRAEILFQIGVLASKAKQSRQETRRDPVVLVYFAGHGLSDTKNDYIVPADFNPYFADDISEMSVNVSQILDRLQDAGPSLRIVITDSCRNSAPVTLPSLSHERVTFMPGGSTEGGDKAVSSTRNGSALIYSTLKGNTATGGENGLFTGEFVDILNNAFTRIKNSGAQAFSTGASLSEVYHNTYTAMDVRGDKQIPMQAGAGPEFNFFPTAADFSREMGLWGGTQKLGARTDDTDLAVDRPRYCLMKQFIENTSVTSYFGEDALKKIRILQNLLTQSDGVTENDLKSLCSEGNESLKTVAGGPTPAALTVSVVAPAAAPPPAAGRPSAPPTVAGTPERVSAPLPVSAPPPAAAPPPTAAPAVAAAAGRVAEAAPGAAAPASPRPAGRIRVSDVMQSSSLSADAKQELADFDPAAPIDSLAVTLAPTKILAAATANAAAVSALDAQKFVQVLGSNGLYAKVQTAKGQQGFVEQKLLGSGVILQALDLTFQNGQLERGSADTLSSLLHRVIPIDALVQYRSTAGASGLADAQNVALRLSESQLSDASSGAFIPKFSGIDSLSSQTIRLTFTAFALDRQVRESPDAIAAPNAYAPSGQDIHTKAQGIPVAVATQATSAILQENAAAPGCENLTATLEGPDKGALAYIQYDGSKNQYALSARILAALTSTGFNKALPERVAPPKLPQGQGEVRRCPQFPATLSDAAINALRICGLGEYRAVTLPASACQRAPAHNVEVWLARPASK